MLGRNPHTRALQGSNDRFDLSLASERRFSEAVGQQLCRGNDRQRPEARGADFPRLPLVDHRYSVHLDGTGDRRRLSVIKRHRRGAADQGLVNRKPRRVEGSAANRSGIYKRLQPFFVIVAVTRAEPKFGSNIVRDGKRGRNGAQYLGGTIRRVEIYDNACINHDHSRGLSKEA